MVRTGERGAERKERRARNDERRIRRLAAHDGCNAGSTPEPLAVSQCPRAFGKPGPAGVTASDLAPAANDTARHLLDKRQLTPILFRSGHVCVEVGC